MTRLAVIATVLASAAYVSADCTVPASWGPYVVSTCTPNAQVLTNTQCAQSCAPPAGAYLPATSSIATCQADGTWGGASLTCEPTTGTLIDSVVWCGTATSSYIAGFSYEEVLLRTLVPAVDPKHAFSSLPMRAVVLRAPKISMTHRCCSVTLTHILVLFLRATQHARMQAAKRRTTRALATCSLRTTHTQNNRITCSSSLRSPPRPGSVMLRARPRRCGATQPRRWRRRPPPPMSRPSSAAHRAPRTLALLSPHQVMTCKVARYVCLYDALHCLGRRAAVLH